MTPADPAAASTAARLTARAVLLGDRIDTAGLERRDAIAAAPLAIRIDGGLAVIFRYGVVVVIGLAPAAEEQVILRVLPHVQAPISDREEEALALVVGDSAEEGVDPDGAVRLADLAPEKLVILSDALAKSVALARDERRMAQVFDTVEPWAAELARGRSPGSRRQMARLIGQALLVQHRLSGRVAVREKPDLLRERPGLERLYARLEDEYELIERGDAMEHKLDLIGDTVTVMTDMIDTQRALRLELAVAALIVAEILLSLVQALKP